MQLSQEYMRKKREYVKALDDDFEIWKPHLREVAEFFLPRRYQWLDSKGAVGNIGNSKARERLNRARNTKIIDPYGTVSIRSLAAGMLNAITSPARPWFSINIKGTRENSYYEQIETQRWKEETLRRMFLMLANSNFYNAMAIQFLDLCCFGSSLFLIYQDKQDVIRCYNIPVGEFRLIRDERGDVSGFTRTFEKKVHELVSEFGEENLSHYIRADWKEGGARRNKSYPITQLVELNIEDEAYVNGNNSHREILFENHRPEGQNVIRLAGFSEKPFAAGRWEVTGSDSYGTSPAMDALPSVIELQQVALEKGKGLAFMNQPPVVMDNVFRDKPGSLLPGGKTFVPNASNFGAKAIYTVQPPVNELRQDRDSLHRDIDALTHNDLFRMISNLDTVRSATEIDARKEEKLVLLAAVLERFEGEVLSPAIIRAFKIMERENLLPERPETLKDANIEIEYVSILNAAQRSVGSAVIERFMQFAAETGSVWQDVLDVIEPDEIMRDYADRLGVTPKGVKSREEAKAIREQKAETESLGQEAAIGRDLAGAASNLSNTDVGGGVNALEGLLSG
jgi:hypothetical protein